MGLGNNNPNQGNKGSNFNYELRVLQLLSQIEQSNGNMSGLATENTLSIISSFLRPSTINNYSSQLYSSGGLDDQNVVKGLQGTIYGFFGYNSGPDQFIQVYDNIGDYGTNGDNPLISIKIDANSNFSFDTGRFGIYCNTGISWTTSTDPTGYTIGGSDVLFYMQYA